MNLRNYLDKLRPNFEKGGKLHAFKSVYDGFDTFLYVPNETSKCGSSIHDVIDSKRIMSIVVISLIPAMLFGMYNIGYQNALAAGRLADTTFMGMFLYGFLHFFLISWFRILLVWALSLLGRNGKVRKFKKVIW